MAWHQLKTNSNAFGSDAAIPGAAWNLRVVCHLETALPNGSSAPCCSHRPSGGNFAFDSIRLSPELISKQVGGWIRMGEFWLVLIGSYKRIGRYIMAYLIFACNACSFWLGAAPHRATSFFKPRSIATEQQLYSFWEIVELRVFLKIFDHRLEILPWKLVQCLWPGSCRCFLHWRLGIRCDFPAHPPSCLVEQEPGSWPCSRSWNDGTNKLGLLPRICKGFTHLVRSRRSGLAFVC